jgi:hypothetical protein
MTIYLCVKTHSITGLKYLCQTKQDPYRYQGSGVYWKSHLKKHGSKHTTSILKECHTKEEIKQWGVYYSDLWDVVNSEEWANLKPEEGDGAASGELNHQKSDQHRKRQSDYMRALGDNHWMKDPVRAAKVKQLNLERMKDPTVRESMSGINHYTKKSGYVSKFTGENNPKYDHTIYQWENKTTGEIISLTRHQFIETFKASAGNVCEVLKGNRQSVSGWKILNNNN